MVKVQAPVLLAVAVPSATVPPSDTVTMEPSGAVPVKVTDSLELATPMLMTGAAGAAPSRSHRTGCDAALVPAEVVSVAVKV